MANRKNEAIAELPCEIVRDLLPLYIDGLTGDATSEAVTAHLAGCGECKAVHGAMADPDLLHAKPINNKRVVDYMKKIKKKHRRAIASVVSVVLVLAIAFLYFFDMRSYAIPVGGFTVAERYMLSENELYVVVQVDRGFAQLGRYSYSGQFNEDETVYSLELGYRLLDYLALDHTQTGYYHFLFLLENEQQIYMNHYGGKGGLLLWDCGDTVEYAPDEILEEIPKTNSGFWRSE